MTSNRSSGFSLSSYARYDPYLVATSKLNKCIAMLKAYSHLKKHSLTETVNEWLNWLTYEKRGSNNTFVAYETDLLAFLGFLQTHFSRPPTIEDLSQLRPADFRAWLAYRSNAGLARSSPARALSVVRGFFGWSTAHRG